MNNKKKQKKIKRLIDDINSLIVYLDAPNNPFGPRGDGAQQCFCVEAYHLFEDIKKELNTLEKDLLGHYGYDKESIQYVDYY